MAVRRTCAAAVLVAGSLLSGCADGSQCEAGAHVVREVGPSLVLDSATGLDGEPVRVVDLSRIRFDGRPVDRRLLASSYRSDGLSLDGGRLVCELPCGLAGTAGRWQLRVTGPAASTASVDAVGGPRIDPGGCSATLGHAPEIALRLTPTP
jgi:hypothetical protein